MDPAVIDKALACSLLYDSSTAKSGHATGRTIMGTPTSSSDNHGAGLALSEETKREIVERKVTCPFLGSAVAQKLLDVKGEAANPLASIEDVRKLGNTGGGDLGDILRRVRFGNHAFMRGDTGKLDKLTPLRFSRWNYPDPKAPTQAAAEFYKAIPRFSTPDG